MTFVTKKNAVKLLTLCLIAVAAKFGFTLYEVVSMIEAPYATVEPVNSPAEQAVLALADSAG